MKIPFGLTLKGMLLSGKDREKARINYIYNGLERDEKLLELDYDTPTLKEVKEYQLKKLELKKKYNLVDDYQYDIEYNNINIKNLNDVDVKIKELDIQYKYEKIKYVDYCKNKNDILGKPWVAIRTNYDEEVNPDDMEVEVVYNKKFIENMRAKGLPGSTDEEIAEQWLKLFFIANLEDDDLKLVSDEYEESPQYLKKTKVGDSTIIG